MLERILLATDGSESASAAARLLAGLPLAAGTEILVVCAVDPFIVALLDRVQEGEKHRARHLVRSVEQTLERPGVKVRGDLRAGNADHQILLAAKEFNADLIVLGSRGLTGLEGFLLGSVARNVAKHAPCSVLVARPASQALSAVVVGTDGSAHGARAVELAAQLPLPEGSSATVVRVLEPQNPMLDMFAIAEETLYDQLRAAEREERAQAEQALEGGRSVLEAAGKRAACEIRTGDPAAEILAVADERRADLLIVGARGNSPIQTLLTGSVADRVLANAKCSVLLVR